MKLHVIPGSPSCRKVQLVLAALGLDAEIRHLDARSGDLRKETFLALNPNGKVPVLEHDGFVLWESNAIVWYLASLAPNRVFAPDDPKMRANVHRWQFWEAAHFAPATAVFLRENVLKPTLSGAPPDEAALEAGAKDFHRAARVLEQHLSTRRYVLGDALTIADFSVAPHLMYAESAKVPWADYTAIRAWYGRIEAESAWIRTAR